jgi:hypothetical protein
VSTERAPLEATSVGHLIHSSYQSLLLTARLGSSVVSTIGNLRFSFGGLALDYSCLSLRIQGPVLFHRFILGFLSELITFSFSLRLISSLSPLLQVCACRLLRSLLLIACGVFCARFSSLQGSDFGHWSSILSLPLCVDCCR